MKPSFDQLARQAYLSPELVVPEGNECSLLLPRITETRFSTSGVVSITDENDVPVLYAAYTLAGQAPLSPDERPGNGKRIVLRSAIEDGILASCKDAEPETAGGPPQLLILNVAEMPFGMLRALGQGPKCSYQVSLNVGKKLFIQRNMPNWSMCITDEDGRLMACCEEAGERGRPVYVSTQVDAGLMTLTMVGIEILDIITAAGGSAGHSSHRIAGCR